MQANIEYELHTKQPIDPHGLAERSLTLADQLIETDLLEKEPLNFLRILASGLAREGHITRFLNNNTNLELLARLQAVEYDHEPVGKQTLSHMVRVGLITKEIVDDNLAARLGIDREFAFAAGLMHDIGKLSVADNYGAGLLSQRRRYSDDDRRKMAKHTFEGEEIIRLRVEELEFEDTNGVIAYVARHHHDLRPYRQANRHLTATNFVRPEPKEVLNFIVALADATDATSTREYVPEDERVSQLAHAFALNRWLRHLFDESRINSGVYYETLMRWERLLGDRFSVVSRLIDQNRAS